MRLRVRQPDGGYFRGRCRDNEESAFRRGTMGLGVCLLVTGLTQSATAQTVDFAFAIGGTEDDRGSDIAVDAQGNSYVIGSFADAADFDPGAGVTNLTGRGFVAKYDSAGNLVFAFGLETTASSVAADPAGNCYLTGSFVDIVDFDPGAGVTNLTSVGSTDTFVAKYDPEGNLIFALRLGDTDRDDGNGIAADALGNSYVTGTFRGTVDLDPGTGVTNLTSVGSTDTFVAKYDPEGNLVSGFGLGSTDSRVSGAAIAVDAAGSSYLMGSFGGTVDFDPGFLTRNLTSNGPSDIFVAMYNTRGNRVFAFALGNANSENAKDVAVDAAGNTYVTGNFTGTVDFDPGAGVTNLNGQSFVAKYDPRGNLIFALKLGGTGGSLKVDASSIAVDGSGNSYVTGVFAGTVHFGATTLRTRLFDAFFVAKYDPMGNPLFAFGPGGCLETGSANGLGISVDDSGSSYVTGFFEENVDFDPGVRSSKLVGAGDEGDIFVVKYAPDPLGEQDCNLNDVPDECDLLPDVYFDSPPASEPLAGLGPIEVQAADLNADGELDLAVSNYDENKVAVLRNLGGGSFATREQYDVGVEPFGLTIADLDGDGRLDLATACVGSNAVSVLYGVDAPGDAIEFAPEVRYVVGNRPFSLTASDLDGDGDMDLAVAGGSDRGRVWLLRNTGDSGELFDWVAVLKVGSFPNRIVAGDLDGDGALDLVTTNNVPFGETVSVLWNMGDVGELGVQSFEPAQPLNTREAARGLAIADLDQDGDLDLVGTGFEVRRLWRLQNNGNREFSLRYLPIASANMDFVCTGDLDDDSRVDLVFVGSGNVVWVLPGVGDGDFAPADELSAGDDLASCVVRDLDGDGVVEVVVANYISDDISIIVQNVGPPQDSDLNGNGVLDECDCDDETLPDCDSDGVPDVCKIWRDGGDCDGNGIPDECEIADGADDCNANGVPDRCEADCDGNGVPDECEIAGGADDCNANGVPDRCEADCDGNGVPDECEIAGGADDCNANGVPDRCEADCDGNGVPNECEIARGADDVNGNSVPDECEDTDEDGIFDEVDGQPAAFSDEFTDVGLDGTTTGTARDRGDQVLIAFDEPHPAGVHILARASGGVAPATVDICDGAAFPRARRRRRAGRDLQQRHRRGGGRNRRGELRHRRGATGPGEPRGREWHLVRSDHSDVRRAGEQRAERGRRPG